MINRLVYIVVLMTSGYAYNIIAATSYLYCPSQAHNTQTPTPFLNDSTFVSSIRYQQVYSASDMVGYPTIVSQGWITELSFQGNEGFYQILPNVEILMSTSSRVPDGLSTTFTENVGMDEMLVFSGPLVLHNDITLIDNYLTHIQLQNPFFYDRSLGNILLEVRNYQTVEPPNPYDPYSYSAVDTFGDGSSILYASDVNALVGNPYTVALRTRFTIDTVPEPSMMGLMAFGLTGVIIYTLRTNKAQRKRN